MLCFDAVVPSAATIVIVVCVSFLAFMIILGVFRIRAAQQKTVRDHESGKENEMDWDDSALTITVNPMEVSSLETTALLFLTFKSLCVCMRASLWYANGQLEPGRLTIYQKQFQLFTEASSPIWVVAVICVFRAVSHAFPSVEVNCMPNWSVSFGLGLMS